MADDDNGNGRVTMARLDTKLDNILERLNEHIDRDERCHTDYETRLRDLKESQTVIKERQNVLTGIQGFISLLLSSVAAWIGSRF